MTVIYKEGTDHNIIWNIHYLALLSFFSADLFIDPVKTDGTVVAPNEICLRSSRTDGSGFLSIALRLRTSPSYKSRTHFSQRRQYFSLIHYCIVCTNWKLDISYVSLNVKGRLPICLYIGLSE